MLRSFRLVNHRSFCDEEELLLMPSRPGDDRAVVPVTAIYGANASGKSSLLDGLRFMKQAVVRSFSAWDAEGSVPRRPFRLRADSSSAPSLFAVDLIVDEVRYTYGFSVDDDRVLEEWLYSYPEKRRRVLFERTKNDIKFGTTVARELKSRLEVIEEITRPNALFLSACAQVRITELMPVYRWFRYQLRMRLSSQMQSTRRLADQIAAMRARHPEMIAKILNLLTAADVGISGVVIHEAVDPFLAERVREMDSEIESIQAEIEKGLSPLERRRAMSSLDRLQEMRLTAVRRASELRPEIKFTHGPSDEEFELEEESAGTRSWLALLPLVLEALAEGQVVAVDEIDTSLHPLLTAELVKLFSNVDTNSKGAQLIFTSHDSSLLGTMMGEEILPRDAVWFVEKRQGGASALFPLTDFKSRDGKNTERRYLGGSYGAVPVLDSEEFSNAVLHS